MHFVCNLDRSIYGCIADDIATNEVIITDERIRHIIDRHPNDFERYYEYLKETVLHPDYIIEANKERTAFILKEIFDKETNTKLKTILRLATSSDDQTYKNSIITYMRIGEKEWNRLLKNKKMLYKRK